MAVFKDCHQRLPKVLLKWWLSLKIVIKDCPKFCWSDGCLERLSSKTAQSSAEVMAVFKDCHQRLPKVLLKWWLSSKTREKTASLRLEKKIREKTANLQRLEKRTREKTAEKRLLIKIFWKSLKIYSFSQGSHLWIWQPSRHFVRVGRSKLW